MQATEEAIRNGFSGECQAHHRYQFFARRAEEEIRSTSSTEITALLKEAALLFDQVAEEETAHAYTYLRALDGIHDTIENLAEAIEGEKNDIFHYTTAAAAARAEGQEEIALSFEQIAAAEKRHLTSYEQLLERLTYIWFADRIKSATSRSD